MKSRINFIWIGIAFIIGVTINNACADNLTPNNNGVLEVLDELREELDSLKDDVADLKHKLMDNSSTIDGLRFGPDGRVCSRPIKREGTVGILEYMETHPEIGGIGYYKTYEYDDKGRLSTMKIGAVDNAGRNIIANVATVNYVDKSIVIILTADDPFYGTNTYTEKIYYE